MSMKTKRWRVRADAASDQLVNQAAAIAHVSTSGFVLSSAVEAARRVLACETATLMPAEPFDALLASLDESEEAPTLARAARSAAHNRLAPPTAVRAAPPRASRLRRRACSTAGCARSRPARSVPALRAMCGRARLGQGCCQLLDYVDRGDARGSGHRKPGLPTVPAINCGMAGQPISLSATTLAVRPDAVRRRAEPLTCDDVRQSHAVRQ